jgi:Tol biopolymer transport system component
VALVVAASLVAGSMWILSGSGHTRPGPGAAPRPSHTALALPEPPIVFASDRGGHYHIHVIEPDGTGERLLTMGDGEDKTPAWSPGRGRIAFVRGVAAGSGGPQPHVFVMDADGTGVVDLSLAGEPGEDPSWSPDGALIVFTAEGVADQATHLRIVGADGAAQPALPLPPSGCSDREPAWSPDGRSIAFARRCGDQPSALYVMATDGSDAHQVVATGRTPAWSPDGSRIAYTGFASEGPAVYIVGADGTGTVQLTTAGSGDPTWSPDGAKLAFTVRAIAVLKLCVIDLDGSDLRVVTSGSWDEVEPSW